MICQCCGRNPASTYIKTVSEGRLTEYALCAECAQQLGCGNLFTGLGYHISDIVREFFDEADEGDEIHCRCCGLSFNDIVRSGRAGCAECYRTFYDRLLPIIRQIHGSDVYRGKVPGSSLPLVRTGGPLAVRETEGTQLDGKEKQ